MDSTPSSHPELRFLEIQNGLVISETGQQDADDFAADFQGLRHFADRIGGALELGPAQYAVLHEPEFTFMFMLPNTAQPGNNASGAMIASYVSNNDLVGAMQSRNA